MSDEPKVPYWVTPVLILGGMAFGVAFWAGVYWLVRSVIGVDA